MKKAYLLAIFVISSCASSKSSNSFTSGKGYGDTRTKEVVFIDNYTYLLTDNATEDSYGYDKSNPIKVGGVQESEGPLNQRRFLDALFGPNDKKMIYWRAGSCCPFETAAGFNNMGMLDMYKIHEIGSNDTLTLFINLYDKGDLLIPVGLKAKEL